jgi:hypothetical protein
MNKGDVKMVKGDAVKYVHPDRVKEVEAIGFEVAKEDKKDK